MSSLLASTLNTRALPVGNLRYIRSDCPTELTDEEVRWLKDNGITTAVDLREEKEILRKPCRLETEEGFHYFRMPVTGGGDTPKSREHLAQVYATMLDEQMDRIIQTLETAESNTIYFCAAGKDRTGVVSAVLLYRMGKSTEWTPDAPDAELVAFPGKWMGTSCDIDAPGTLIAVNPLSTGGLENTCI